MQKSSVKLAAFGLVRKGLSFFYSKVRTRIILLMMPDWNGPQKSGHSLRTVQYVQYSAYTVVYGTVPL